MDFNVWIYLRAEMIEAGAWDAWAKRYTWQGTAVNRWSCGVDFGCCQRI